MGGPFSTIDPALASGVQIPIEGGAGDEVRRVGAHQTAPTGTPVYNPAFDVTPAALITAIITERGVFRPPYAFDVGGSDRRTVQAKGATPPSVSPGPTPPTGS